MKLIILFASLATSLKLTTAQTCDLFFWGCDNGRCVHGTFICDGVNDCGDMSDERDEEGTCPACPQELYQCNNGKCTFGQYICDGDNDCGDGSDEADENGNCPDCPDESFQCASTGRCLFPWDVCDGDNDCGDWSDESEATCPCSDDEMRCTPKSGEGDGAPGICIPDEWICDEEGIWDCPNGDDEANCTTGGNLDSQIKSQRARPIRLNSKKVIKEKITKKLKYSKKLSSKSI